MQGLFLFFECLFAAGATALAAASGALVSATAICSARLFGAAGCFILAAGIA